MAGSAAALRLRGLAMVAAATALWSLSGYFTRLLPLDVWTIQFWRAAFGGAGIFAVMALTGPGSVAAQLRAISPLGWFAVPVSGFAMVAYIWAVTLTTVANVMVVYATTPFVAAAMAYFWIGERPARRVLAASLVALAGVALMAGGALAPGDVAGNALAFAMTALFAALIVLARRDPTMSLAPVNACAAVLAMAVCAPLAPTLAIGAREALILLVFGLTSTTVAFGLFMLGARHVPAAEAGLIGLLEVILSPLWVWLAFDERPAPAALWGGGLVLAALAAQLGLDWRESRRVRAAL